MVKLSLSSSKGNTGLRYFPCSGYLGLTPIRAEGVVRTRLEDDQKPLLARAITISIRCYECRTRVASGNYSNVLVDHTQLLWSKQDGVEYEPIENLEFPFQIALPANVAGFSSAIFVDYRCIWRIEAVLSHIPIAGVGARQVRHSDLHLVRYDIPSWLPFPLAPEPMLNLETDKPRAPRMKYSIHPPKAAIGPMDLVSIPLHLQPLDKDVSIRSASVVVERRIVLNDNPAPPNLPPGLYTRASDSSLHKQPPSPHFLPVSSNAASSSTSLLSLPSDPEPTQSLHSAGSTITPDTFYPSTSSAQPNTISTGQQPSSKTITHPIACVHSSGSFTRDQNGVFSKTLTLQWPCAKSRAHWAIGETITSDLVSVKFFLRTKIVTTSSHGTDTIELADEELFVVSTNDAERQLATAKYNEQLETLSLGSATIRSKSKSPRRLKAERTVDDDSNLPLPSEYATLPSLPKHNNGDTYGKLRSTEASSAPAPARGGKSNRRPHTSAGPRDRPVNFAGAAYEAGTSGTTKSGHNPKGFESGASVTSPIQSKRHSETIMRNVLNRPDYFESYALNKGASTKRGGNGNISRKASSSKSIGLVSSTAMDIGNFFRNPSTASSSSSGHSSAISSGDGWNGDSLSQTTEDLREWEEELVRIEARSKESSVLFASAKKTKKSMDHSNNSHSNVGIVASEEPLPVQRA